VPFVLRVSTVLPASDAAVAECAPHSHHSLLLFKSIFQIMFIYFCIYIFNKFKPFITISKICHLPGPRELNFHSLN
jgi:hypothetical protein